MILAILELFHSSLFYQIFIALYFVNLPYTLCIYDFFHIPLFLWRTYGSVECMYVCKYVCMYVCTHVCIYKACSKNDRTFAIKTLLAVLQHFKHCPLQVVPSTGDTPFPTFLPLLECFLEHTFCDGEQSSYRIFLNFLYGLEKTSFQSGFKFWKQEKVCWV